MRKRINCLLILCLGFLMCACQERGGENPDATPIPKENVDVVLGEGSGADTLISMSGDVIIPEIVEDETTKYRIIGISDNFCNDNALITSLVLPDSVISIGEHSFKNCSALEKVSIGANTEKIGQSCFYNCIKLSEVITNEKLVSIGRYAFYGNKKLKSIVIPDSVTELGSHAFEDCLKLESVQITLTGKTLGEEVFKNTKWLSSKKDKNGLVIVENILLSGTSAKGDVVIPDGVTTILGGAFAFDFNQQSRRISSVVIPNTVTEIGNYAFRNNMGMTSVTFENGSSLTKIGYGAFDTCLALKELLLPETLKYIGAYAFQQCISLKELTFPDNLVQINEYLCFGCSSLTYVKLPDSLRLIGEGAFEGCSSLKSVSFPGDLAQINDDAFRECAIEELILHNGIKTIGENVFTDCENAIVYMDEENTTNIKSNAFTNTKMLVYAGTNENAPFGANKHVNWSKSLQVAFDEDAFITINEETNIPYLFFSFIVSAGEYQYPYSYEVQLVYQDKTECIETNPGYAKEEILVYQPLPVNGGYEDIVLSLSYYDGIFPMTFTYSVMDILAKDK